MTDSDPATPAPARRPLTYLLLLAVAVLLTMLVSGPVSETLDLPRVVVSMAIALVLGTIYAVVVRSRGAGAPRD